MAKSVREVGTVNRHGQKLIAETDKPGGTDPQDKLWIVECTRPGDEGNPCGYRYGSNGSEFFQRKCPVCQGGQPGISITGIVYE